MIKGEKVSVIIPVYNVESYLSKCLDSCVAQTLCDVEFICVNDGSTDHSQTLLEHYAARDSRFRILCQENKGLSAARNAGIRAARGAWIMFLDSDDYLRPYACERVWRESLEQQVDIMAFSTQMFPEYPVPEDASWYHSVLTVRTEHFDRFRPHVLFQTPGAKPFVWRQAFRAELLRQKGLLFDETVRYGEDLIFQMEAFPHAQHFSFLADALYCYRAGRAGSLMDRQKSQPDCLMESHLQMARIITAYWQAQGWLKRYADAYLSWLLAFFVYDLEKLPLTRRAEHARALQAVLSEYALLQLARPGGNDALLLRRLKRLSR